MDDGDALQFDHVVVGGGSAGCVLAARLSEDPGVRVCLLEAGPADTSVLIHCPAGLALLAKTGTANWAFETVPQAGFGGRRGYQPRGKTLGGSSSVNAMIYLRGAPSDYDGWAAEGNPGWAWDDVLPFFKRAEHNERGANPWHGTGGPLNVADLRSPHRFGPIFVDAGVEAGYARNPDFNGRAQEGVGLYQVTHRDGERCSAAKAYLAPALAAPARPNLTVVTGARTTRVLVEAAAGRRRAVGVEAIVDGARRRFLATREVVLSAGALQSPQLLLLSGIGPGAELQAHGIPVVHDLPGVGRHLHDHVDVVQVLDAPRLTDLFGVSPRGIANLVSGVLEWRRHRKGLLTTNFAEAGGFVKSSPGRAEPDLQLHFVVGKLVDHGRTSVYGHGYSCHVCLLDPQSRGSVTLARADPLAGPRIDPAFFAVDDDLERLADGFLEMRRILAQPVLAAFGARELETSARARTRDEVRAFLRAHADTIYHPVGTCRMGRGPLDVVDAELRVRGVEGLRVVDASIMPTIVRGNTNAPTVMIAEKAAELMRRRGATVTTTGSEAPPALVAHADAAGAEMQRVR